MKNYLDLLLLTLNSNYIALDFFLGWYCNKVVITNLFQTKKEKGSLIFKSDRKNKKKTRHTFSFLLRYS